MAFILAASNETLCGLYRNYLDDDEYAYLRANIGKRGAEWPPLIAQVRTAMDEGRAPGSPEVQALENEPGLAKGGWVDAPMRAFIRAAMEAMRAGFKQGG